MKAKIKAEDTFKAGAMAVMQFVEDWETLFYDEFKAKYGVHRDEYGFTKSLVENIKLHFGLKKLATKKA